MKLTLLDHLLQTCQKNQDLPVCTALTGVVNATRPVPHRWSGWADAAPVNLPAVGVIWPDEVFCLSCDKRPIVEGLHRFCVDVGHSGMLFDAWFLQAGWELSGVMVFQKTPEIFDVIPLVIDAQRRQIVLPELQLHFMLTPKGWSWQRSETGPVNALFHGYFMELMPEESNELADEAAVGLGNLISGYLGAYREWFMAEGRWNICAAKPPRVKLGKDGKVKKVYFAGSVGYKEYVHKKSKKEMSDVDANDGDTDSEAHASDSNAQ